ncbi:MAG: carbohydrate ABC transporter permease [Treponema sp.]|jgi:putative aldouronate transport system permease protein|nr:carbohydrate ABC transporter permease [Treponema sp.]
MNKIMKVKESAGVSDYIFKAAVIVISIFVFVVVAYPMYFIVIASISNSTLVNLGQVILWPKDINFYGYQQVFQDERVWTGYGNTILYTVVGTLLNLVVTIPAAYALACKKFRPRKIIMPMFVFTMFFGGGMIPTYMVVRSLHLVNTPFILIIMGAINVYNLIVTRTFIQSSIPYEFYEAAVIEGCSHFRYFGFVIVPLSKAIVSVMLLYYAVGHWNEYFSALMYISSNKLVPLQIVLRNILILNEAFKDGIGTAASGGYGGDMLQYVDQIKFAIIIVSVIPILCVYPFIQKYFEKGVMIGGIKG